MSGNMSTGSDTRMYAPRSESMLGYTKDEEDYAYGIGDPEAMEAAKDKRIAQQDAEIQASDLPHLVLEVPKPEPEMPPPPQMPAPEDAPVMDDGNENARGAEISQMTGMPDMGNLSVGNATGTMPAPGGMLRASEPMDNAWSSLMKGRLDKVKGAEDKSWKQPQYRIQPGGANISTATSRRAKLHSRYLQPSKKHGLMRSPLSVHMTHLGVATKQPLKLFPEKYRHQMGIMARRKLMGNIPQPMSGHGLSSERTYNPKPPTMTNPTGLKIREPSVPRLMGQSLSKSDKLAEVKKQFDEVSKKMNYMHFAQMRRLLRQMKNSMENRDRRLKAAVSAGPGQNREAGHREGQDSTTRNEGATEDMENDPKNWGAPALLFASRGSGRVG